MLSLSAAELLHLKKVIDQRRPGYGLPRPLYHDQLLYQAEMDAIWRGGWLFAGHSCQIPNPGDYFLYDVDGDSVIIVRDKEGQVQTLYNVCRHRGSLICEAPEGHVKRFICPYHQWTYDLDGKLLLWRGMQDGLDKSQLGLHHAHAREFEGFIFISFAREPMDFEAAYETIAPVTRPQGLSRAKVAKIMDFDVHSNWKLVWENNRECFHCVRCHPQYVKANFDIYDEGTASEAVADMAATKCSSCLQNASPLSYGTFSHLCASVAHESACSTPSARYLSSGQARAHKPNAPSTCTHAPVSCARRQISATGSKAPVFTLPAWMHTIALPLSGGNRSARMRP